MKLSDFNYNLPQELIAQQPIKPRDHSRLLVLDRQSKKITHRHFYDILDYLHQGDVLVLNNTKVFPARLIGKRKDTGGKVEVFLLKKIKDQNAKIKNTNQNSKRSGDTWECLIGNRRKKVGQIVEFAKNFSCQIVKQLDQSVWLVEFNKSGKALDKLIEKYGQVPTPPYIKIPNSKSQFPKKSQFSNFKIQNIIKREYQTVFAKYTGSVAAPTAGFHFTKKLLGQIKKKGVKIEYITLHVGYGTFEPVKVEDITKHQMHSELVMIDKGVAEKLTKKKKDGKRIIAVGTTTTRALEAMSDQDGKLKSGSKWVNIFIYPGYKLKFIDSLITNFHLPKSTLLMLVSTLAGRPFILKAYNLAVKKKYRFYSFGDAMMIK